MHVISVSQATAYLRELLENDLVLGDVWISGEVSGPRTQPSGHTYFVLKDANSQLRGVLFRSALLRQRKMAEYLEHGAQVMVHGRLTVYEARGELQIVVDFVQPEGVGLRQAQFERLRTQLEEEGLFDPARKRLLPVFPNRIGVVTSPSGAVFHDICNVLRRRWPLAQVVLAPTPVQGPEAPYGIVAGIEALNRRGDLDVIIVARGGGSVEELWAFNEEAVARAVFASVIPTVSAVGHETDTTICDWVADVRAPTPSAAAELVAPDWLQIEQRLAGYVSGAYTSVRRQIDGHLTSTTTLLNRAGRSSADVSRHRQRIDDLDRRALNSVAAAQRDRRAHLRRCEAQLVALDPNATLKRGYAVVHKEGHVVSTIANVTSGDRLIIKIADGGFGAQVAGPATRRTPRRATSNGTGPKKNGSSPTREPGVQPVLFP
jgi:exodeoxyribonuclease VII large subunit